MKYVHYIWLSYESSTGSSQEILLRNGKFSLDGAKKFMHSITARALYKSKPQFLKDCVKITLSAQNILTSKTLYRRVINVRA